MPFQPPMYVEQGAKKIMTAIEQLVADARSNQPMLKSSVLATGKFTEKDVPDALKRVDQNPDRSSYHLLFALRRTAAESYRNTSAGIRARILADALAHVQFLNDWGFLDRSGSHDGEAAVALLETGREAIRRLEPLLDDSSPAPLYGSEPAAMASSFKYRRKDFAYRYLSLILGRPADFAEDPTVRDRSIDRLKAELRGHN